MNLPPATIQRLAVSPDRGDVHEWMLTDNLERLECEASYKLALQTAAQA
mgnify:CR=1 FL=1